MKKAKKILSMLLALTLLLTSVQVPAYAAQTDGETVEAKAAEAGEAFADDGADIASEAAEADLEVYEDPAAGESLTAPVEEEAAAAEEPAGAALAGEETAEPAFDVAEETARPALDGAEKKRSRLRRKHLPKKNRKT